MAKHGPAVGVATQIDPLCTPVNITKDIRACPLSLAVLQSGCVKKRCPEEVRERQHSQLSSSLSPHFRVSTYFSSYSHVSVCDV
jgi:hypothetical protein